MQREFNSILFESLYRELYRNCCCSVTQSCLILWDPMDCTTPGLPVPHHLPEFAQICVHWIGALLLFPQLIISSPNPQALCTALSHTQPQKGRVQSHSFMSPFSPFAQGAPSPWSPVSLLLYLGTPTDPSRLSSDVTSSQKPIEIPSLLWVLLLSPRSTSGLLASVAVISFLNNTAGSRRTHPMPYLTLHPQQLVQSMTYSWYLVYTGCWNEWTRKWAHRHSGKCSW